MLRCRLGNFSKKVDSQVYIEALHQSQSNFLMNIFEKGEPHENGEERLVSDSDEEAQVGWLGLEQVERHGQILQVRCEKPCHKAFLNIRHISDLVRKGAEHCIDQRSLISR